MTGHIQNVDTLLLVTSAEISYKKELRTEEYIEVAKIIQDNAPENFRVQYIETVTKGNSFLEEYHHVFYSKIHSNHPRNKGAQLMKALKRYVNTQKPTEKYVIQLTGRYKFNDTYFFDIIKNNPGYDVYVLPMKSGKYDAYFTGCFCMSRKWFQMYCNSYNWEKLYKSVEINFHDFVKRKKLKVFRVDKLNMRCNVFYKNGIESKVIER